MAKSSFARPPAPGAPAGAPKPPAPPTRAAATATPPIAAPRRTAPGATPPPPVRTAPRPPVAAAAPVATAPVKPAAPPAPPARRAPAPRAAAPPVVEEEELPPEEEGQQEEAPAEEIETEVLPPEEEPEAPPAPATRARRRAPAAPTKTAPEPEKTLATVPQGTIGQVSGAPIDMDDLDLPQLSVGQKVGPLSDLGVPLGTIVVGAGEQLEYLYAEGSLPIGVTFIRTDKCFRVIKNEDGDKLYDMEEQGEMFTGPNAKELMIAAGGTLQDVRGQKVCEAMLICEVLIRMPDGLANEFGMFQPVEGDEGLFVRALWRIRGTGYYNAGKKLLSENKGHCTNGSHKVEFNLTSRIVPGKNIYAVPILTNGAIHSEEFVAYIEASA